MIRKLAAMSLCGLLLFIACKKDSTPSSPPNSVTDSAAILGKWRPIRDVQYSYQNNAFLDSAHSILSSLDYYTFGNGNIYTYENDESSNNRPLFDTVPYHIYQGQYLVVNNSDTFKIKVSADSLLLTTTRVDATANPVINSYDTLQLIKFK